MKARGIAENILADEGDMIFENPQTQENHSEMESRVLQEVPMKVFSDMQNRCFPHSQTTDEPQSSQNLGLAKKATSYKIGTTRPRLRNLGRLSNRSKGINSYDLEFGEISSRLRGRTRKSAVMVSGNQKQKHTKTLSATNELLGLKK